METPLAAVSAMLGELSPTAMVQEPCTSQPAVKLSKQSLLGLLEACSWLPMWKDCHPSSPTHGMRSMGPTARSECCGSRLQMGLRSLLHGVCSFSLSLCGQKESNIPGFFAWFHSHIFVQGFYSG